MKMVRRSRIGPGVLALTVSAALAAALATVPAVAAANVTLHEGSSAGPALEVEQAVTGFSENLVFEAEWGNLECTANEIGGEVTSDGAAVSEIEITRASFTAEEEGTRCRTTIPGPIRPLTMEWTPIGLPWHLSLAGNGTAALTGDSSVGISMVFYAEVSNGVVAPVARCAYQSAEIPSTYPFGVPLIDVIPPKRLALESSEGECAPSGELSGEFDLTLGGERGGEAVVATNP